MPSLVVTNAALVRMVWSLSGVPYAVNVLGAQNPSGTAVTQGATNALGAAFKTALTTSALDDYLSSEITLDSIFVRNINVPNQAELKDVAAAAAGTSASDLLPPQVALCMTLRTALAGRSFRGRTYLCGFAENASSPPGGTVLSAAAEAARTFMESLRTAMTTNGLPMAVISRPDEDAIPPKVGFLTPVTSVGYADLVWDTQRRRAVPGI